MSQEPLAFSSLKPHMCFQLATESGMGWVLAKKGKQHNRGLGAQRGEVMCQGHTAKSAVELGLVPREPAFSSLLAVTVWLSLLSLCSCGATIFGGHTTSLSLIGSFLLACDTGSAFLV